jgi:hypothetical protein
MPGRPNNTTVVDASVRRLRALASYADDKTKIAINGRKLALVEVLAIYQESLDSRADLARQRAATKAAMGRRATAEAARLEADRALKAWVTNEFGIESTEATDFGFPPAKKPQITVEAKALAVARRKATREARHTMGTRQKAEIRGTLAAAAVPAPTKEGEGPDDTGAHSEMAIAARPPAT